MIFGAWAKTYYDLGLIPLPLGKPDWEGRKAKAAFTKGWQKVARNRYSPAELAEYIDKFPDRNIGLACGTILFDDLQIVAIDIDDEQYIEYVEAALPFTLSAKRGAKGITHFVLAPKDLSTRRLGNADGTMVEILALGSQTVLPPSIHPGTKSPYVWVGEPLHEINLRGLPIINNAFILELQSITSGNGQYFVGGKLESGEELTGINNMAWAGVGGGGNTYDSRLRCVAHMVATGWQDEEIIARIRRAQQLAVERAGEEFNWPDCERETQQQIDDARKKDFDKNSKANKRPAERIWADWLTTQYDFPVCYADILFHYIDGHYSQVPPAQVTSKIIRTFDNATAAKAKAAHETFLNIVYRDDFGSEGHDKVCLLNGTLEVGQQILRPWSPDDELLYRLDIEWDPDAECPNYNNFVSWVFGDDEDQIRAWDEYCGLTFVDDVSFQKALFLLGGGANGKSTLANLLGKMHHKDMISSIGITELDNERKVTSMVGKLVNISTEQSRINNITDAVFKQIVGGDPVTVRRLFKEAENNIVLKVRFVCLANELPSVSDNTDAMRRRLLILNCPNSIEEGKRDPNLINKLLAEKSGIMRRWVRALADLKDRGHFIIPDQSKRAVDEYMDGNDQIKTWVTRYVLSSTKAMDVGQAYTYYADWAKNSGHKPFALAQWEKAMRRLGHSPRDHRLPDGSVASVINIHVRMAVSVAGI